MWASRSTAASQRAAAAWSIVDECRSAACLATTSDERSDGGRPDPADPQPRGRDLRQRRQAQRAVGGERAEARQRLAAVAELAVRVVLEQPEPAALGDRGQRDAPLQRQRASGRVVERRDRVEHPRAVARRRRGDRVGIEAVVVARDRHHARARERERLQRREVRRLLDEHDVARLDQHGRGERERLLRAAADEHLVGLGRQPARGQPRRDRGAQLRVALGGRVLQRAAAVGERVGERRAQPDGVEQLRRRQAAGERDHARAGGQGEDVADRRAAHAAQSRGDLRLGRHGAQSGGGRGRHCGAPESVRRTRRGPPSPPAACGPATRRWRRRTRRSTTPTVRHLFRNVDPLGYVVMPVNWPPVMLSTWPWT